MRTARINGETIPESAIAFEFDRLAAFYVSHGTPAEEIKAKAAELREKALEQAIGARLLSDAAARLDIRVAAAALDAEIAKAERQMGGREKLAAALAARNIDGEAFRRSIEKSAKVNALVEKACAHIDDPEESEIEAFWETRADRWRRAGATLVSARETIRDLLRHEARGRAVAAYVADLRSKAVVEYVDD